MTTSVRETVSSRGDAKGITTADQGQQEFSEPIVTPTHDAGIVGKSPEKARDCGPERSRLSGSWLGVDGENPSPLSPTLPALASGRDGLVRGLVRSGRDGEGRMECGRG